MSEPNSIPLLLTAYEQDAIANLAQVCKSVHWIMIGDGDLTTLRQVLEAFPDVIERFDRIRWDVIYDKMHRTGANA